MYIILGVDQKEYGPAGADEIRRWIAEGRANAQTSARAEDATEWRPLNAFPEFAAAFAAPVQTLSVGGGSSTHTNGLAIAGFVLGLASIVCCFAGVPCSILGLIFSIIGLAQINKHPAQGGKGLAIAGIILCVLGLLLFGLLMLAGMFGSLLQEAS